MKMALEGNLSDGTAVDKPEEKQSDGLTLDTNDNKPTSENVHDSPSICTESDSDEGGSSLSTNVEKRMDKVEILEKLSSLCQNNINGTSNSCDEESVAGIDNVDPTTEEEKTIPDSSNPTRGGGDADGSSGIDSSPNSESEAPGTSRSALPSDYAKSSGKKGIPPLKSCMRYGSNPNSEQKLAVYFSDSVVFLKTSEEAKKSICKVRSSSGLTSLTPFSRFNKSKKTESEGEIDSQQVSGLPKNDEDFIPMSDLELQFPGANFPAPVSSKHETIKQLAATLTPKSMKSKQLETKFQQTIRLRYFDYEAQRASEEWKFRKGTEALDLEYQRKYLNLMKTHNDCKEKLHEKFIKQVKKTEKKLKKVAQKGQLNEGSCFNVSHNISSFKINKY